MNIIVRTYGGHYIVRPDTTWEKDNEDLYAPEFSGELTFTPVLFARISKPGKYVGEQFASRYFDTVNYGILVYPMNMMDGSPEAFACASCMDHTSFLPFPMYQKIVLGQGNDFALNVDGNEVFRTSEGTLAMIERAISEATKSIYIRTGDLIAIELAPMSPLMSRETKSISVEGSYCDNFAMSFRIVRE